MICVLHVGAECVMSCEPRDACSVVGALGEFVGGLHAVIVPCCFLC